MSAVASEAKALTGDEISPEIESETDRHETLIEYDPTAKVPIPVVMVWICALVGLGAYAVTWFLPELQLWGAP